MSKSSATMARISSILVCALVLAGCESGDQKADRVAMKKVDTAEKDRAKVTDPKMLDSIQSAFDSAASEPGMSDGGKAAIRGRQAQLRFERALFMAGDLRGKEMGIAQTINELQDLAMQLSAAQASVRALKGYDPSSQIDALKSRQTDIQAKLSALADSMQQMNATLASDQAAADELHKASSDAQDRAETLDRKSEGERGDAQTQDIVATATLRRDAGVADAKAGTIAAQMTLIKANLDTAQLQKAALEATNNDLDGQVQTLQSEWTVVKQQIDAQRKLQQQLIGDETAAAPTGDQSTEASSPAAPTTITSGLDLLVKQRQDADGLRDSVVTELTGAVSQFGDAATSAEHVRSELIRRLQEKPNDAAAPIWRQNLETLHPMYFGLQKAAAMQELAYVSASKTGIDVLISQLLDGFAVDAAMRSSAQFKAMGLGPTTAPSTVPSAQPTAAPVVATDAATQPSTGQPSAGDTTAAPTSTDATTQPSAQPTVAEATTQPSLRIDGLNALLDPELTGVPTPKVLADVVRVDPDALKQQEADVDSRYKDILDAYDKRYGTDTTPMAGSRTNIALMGRALANRQWAHYSLMIGDLDASQQHQQDADSDESHVDPAFRTLATASIAPPAAADNSGAVTNPSGQ
jgi:PBP1b-binding outer membrane lipoprotein LpoB